MKIIHTADWHLGQTFFEYDRKGEHTLFLTWLREQVKVHEVDGLFIAGIEAAIDLAGICSKVTVFEFMDELKADQVLQEKLKSLPNVEVFVHSQTTEVIGNGDKVTGICVSRSSGGHQRMQYASKSIVL